MAIPILFLRGDRAKAATWVPWAKNQLQRLKGVSNIVNQIYRPAVGVGIHVRSGAGIDMIRVVVQPLKVPCRVNFSADIISGIAPFTASFDVKISDNILGTLLVTGDRQITNQTSYAYQDQGIYSPKFKAWANRKNLPSVQVEIINRTKWQKDPGYYFTYNEAYSAFISGTWIPSNGQTYTLNAPWGSATTNADPRNPLYIASAFIEDFEGSPTTFWRVRAHKDILTIKFSDLEIRQKYISTFSGQGGSFDLIQEVGWDSGVGVSFNSNILGIKRHLGAKLGSAFIAEVTDIAIPNGITGVFADVEVEVIDGNNYAQLIDPDIIGTATGWHMAHFGDYNPGVIARPYSCLAVKQKIDYITVT